MAIELRGLKKAFGGREVLKGLSAVLPEEGVVEIAGRSGAGKTTLLRILMGLESADSGQILGLSGRKIGAVFQENRLLEHLSAVDNVRFVCNAPRETILDHLAQVGLSAQAQERVSAYSGGMKRRTAIVRAVLYPCDLLLMDEPFTGVDEQTKAQVIRYLLRECRGRLVLLVSHDHEEARALNAVARLEIGGEANEP